MRLEGLLVLAWVGGLPQSVETPEHRSWTITNEQGASRYEQLYGPPQFWTLELLVGPEARPDVPSRQSIRTLGRLRVIDRPGGQPQVRLCTEDARGCLSLDTPATEIAQAFFAETPFRRDDEAEVTGAFAEAGFLFWSFASAPPRQARDDGREVALEHLVRSPERLQRAGGSWPGGRPPRSRPT
jgi:hypothetical protein